jgi:hypothetical protein
MSGVGVMAGIAINGAILGGAVAAPAIGAWIGGDAAKNASQEQVRAADQGMAAVEGQQAATDARFDPYGQAGLNALQMQEALSGALGPQAQQQAIQQYQNSPQFQSMLQAGNDNILANASATGNLRGGNTQGALAQFAPQLLNQMLQQQYQNLGGLSSMGLQATGQQAGYGAQSAGQIADLYGQRGAARAGGILGVAGAQTNALNQYTNMVGTGAGLGLKAATGGGF